MILPSIESTIPSGSLRFVVSGCEREGLGRIARIGNRLGRSLTKHLGCLVTIGDQLTFGFHDGTIHANQPHGAPAQSQHMADFEIVAGLGKKAMPWRRHQIFPPIGEGKTNKFLRRVGEKLVDNPRHRIARSIMGQHDIAMADGFNGF